MENKQQFREVKKRSRKPVDQAITYQSVFSSPEGEKVLFDLMRTHNVMSSTFSKDHMEMALKEGERNVVLRILSILKIDVDALAKKIEKGLREEESYYQ